LGVSLSYQENAMNDTPVSENGSLCETHKSEARNTRKVIYGSITHNIRVSHGETASCIASLMTDREILV